MPTFLQDGHMRILLVDDIIVPCPTCVRSEEQSRLTHSIKVTLCPENCIPLGTDLDVSLEHSLLELLNWICDECELISIPPDVCRKIVFYIFVLRLRCAAAACSSLSALLWVKRGVFKINSRFFFIFFCYHWHKHNLVQLCGFSTRASVSYHM